ncbi:S41 family peptidase [Algimonas porphyrae]|uniref:Tail specific protease domain-containing protein n=1 Tax=Algimonas porphyrae TaxID=1128113 RepID=A0ABQ5UZL6_9PROT|nr:hypothetical protein [Algimonas porphyrae]GLQ20696.1 hypothetical protein GCM10007854_16510 [Algimonas porphyrae]
MTFKPATALFCTLTAITLALSLGASPLRAAPDDPASVEDETAAFDASALWDEVRADFDLFYAYRDRRGFDADAYLNRVGAYVTAADKQAEFRRRLNRATYAFTDPHLGFGPSDDQDFNVIPTASDLQIGYEAGRYVVLDVRAGSAAMAAGVRPGWMFTHAGDEPVDDATRKVFDPLIDNPSDAQRAYAATLLANGRRTGDRALGFKTADGEAIDLVLANPRNFAWVVTTQPHIETRWIVQDDGTDIAVLRINNRLGDNDLIIGFDAAMRAVLDADGLILDLRNTPSGGNTEVGRSIIGHFVEAPTPYQMHERPSLEREFGVPRRYVEYVLPRRPAFDPKRTVVIGGYWTGSMGEGIIVGMDAAGVQTIASDMGDLLGNKSDFTFAGGAITHSIPTETLFHVDGTPREDFVADIALAAADSDERGSDPAIRAALDYLSADN